MTSVKRICPGKQMPISRCISIRSAKSVKDRSCEGLWRFEISLRSLRKGSHFWLQK